MLPGHSFGLTAVSPWLAKTVLYRSMVAVCGVGSAAGAAGGVTLKQKLQALAWLRDNGRYLAPSGAGDYLYALALALRNWLAMQYVVGTVIGLVVMMRLGQRMI